MRTRAPVSVCVASFVALCASPAVGAGEVSVSGLHICCGACVKAIDKALSAVDGVSDVDVDREAKEVHFQVGDAETGRAALEAVVKAGYFGKAKYDGRGVDMPQDDIEKNAKADHPGNLDSGIHHGQNPEGYEQSDADERLDTLGNAHSCLSSV